jgi:argininosuccinate lyase
MGPVLTRIRFDKKRMAELAGAHWSQATDLADLLVRQTGVSFRQAHRVTGTLVAAALNAGIAPAAVTPKMLVQAAVEAIGRPLRVPAARLRQAVDPWQSVLGRKLEGGPAPEVVRPALEEASARIASDSAQLDQLGQGIEARRSQLQEAAESLVRLKAAPL